MAFSADDTKRLLIRGIEQTAAESIENNGPVLDQIRLLLESFDIDYATVLYAPDNALNRRISDYIDWCEGKSSEDAGQLMEELALLAFQCLKGHNSVKSYQSYAAQHDLVISGGSIAWDMLMTYMHLPKEGRTILVEAKNLSETQHGGGKIDDSQFARVCGILYSKFVNTAHLGVFFSRNGATGFPQNGQNLRSLHDAQATQILFHARTNKYVVVLSDVDIRQLGEPGALPRILEAKIRDIEAWTGRSIEFSGDWREVLLPPHLLRHIRATDVIPK